MILRSDIPDNTDYGDFSYRKIILNKSMYNMLFDISKLFWARTVTIFIWISVASIAAVLCDL